VKGFRFDGADRAGPAPGVREALQSADAIVICPSNPWVSIDPILNVISPCLAETGSGMRIMAVSPIIGGKAVKGPAAKMFRELGIEPSALEVARHYRGLATDFVLDSMDAQLKESVGGLRMQTFVTNTLMLSHDDRRQLAREMLSHIGSDI
jgi:LPPG:FO 2-phospho-L-lactate transferase